MHAFVQTEAFRSFGKLPQGLIAGSMVKSNDLLKGPFLKQNLFSGGKKNLHFAFLPSYITITFSEVVSKQNRTELD